MPQLEYFEARVFVGGRMLQEYPVVEEDSSPDHIRKCYIEMKTGDRFHVELTWLRHYELHWAHALCAEVQFDDNPDFRSYAIDCREIYFAEEKITVDLRRVLSSIIRKEEATRMWKEYTLRFGALGVTDKPSDYRLAVNEMPKIGSIQVRFYRASRIRLDRPRYYEGNATLPVDEVPEKLLKGNPIKNNVKYEEGIPAPYTPTTVDHYDYVPIEGPHGKVQKFIFFYRTHKALQHLGIIPKSPSPEPDAKLIVARTEEMIKEMKQARRKERLESQRQVQESIRQVRELQERLDKLQQGGLGIKTEPSEQSTINQGFKRAREEDDDELTEMPPPAQKPKVLIDLTEDDDD